MPDLQLSLWREASRARDLPEAVARMTALLGRRVPIGRVFVRHFDPEAEELETLAVGQVEGGSPPGPTRTPCTREQLDELRVLAAGGIVLLNGSGVRTPGAGQAVGAVVPKGVRGQVAAGLLAEPGGVTAGVLVAVLRAGAEIGESARADLGRSLEPFAVALAHHRRVHELEKLREAAEAEKVALLTRLGRREIVEEIVGEGGSLRAVMTRVEQVAPTDAPVLILGETGTGKEVIARAIHARSARADGPIVRVNCGAIPSELVDSELFGHEKGAFTGALAERKGWFERADGGTLFLDEIAELPLAAQVRLLRILQDGTYERVGGQQTRTADVRILAATHRDVEALVAEGRFREDLWYRISVFPLYLPPLRSRRDDIPALALHFAQSAGLRIGSAPLDLGDDDLQVLLAYPWPGNVRELAAVVERAAILGGGHRLDVRGAMGTKLHALQERLGDPSGPTSHGGAAHGAAHGGEAFPTLDEAMRRHIEHALRHCGGRVEGPNGAAALLGINPYTLRGRMRKLGVDWQRFRAA